MQTGMYCSENKMFWKNVQNPDYKSSDGRIYFEELDADSS